MDVCGCPVRFWVICLFGGVVYMFEDLNSVEVVIRSSMFSGCAGILLYCWGMFSSDLGLLEPYHSPHMVKIHRPSWSLSDHSPWKSSWSSLCLNVPDLYPFKEKRHSLILVCSQKDASFKSKHVAIAVLVNLALGCCMYLCASIILCQGKTKAGFHSCPMAMWHQ